MLIASCPYCHEVGYWSVKIKCSRCGSEFTIDWDLMKKMLMSKKMSKRELEAWEREYKKSLIRFGAKII